MDVKEKFAIVPDGSTNSGARRALLIGINYVGQQGQLSGCHNDVGNIKDYIMDVHGFKEEDITVLMDDGSHENPTFDNIISAFRKLVGQTEAGDCAFLHYSGESVCWMLLCCNFMKSVIVLSNKCVMTIDCHF